MPSLHVLYKPPGLRRPGGGTGDSDMNAPVDMGEFLIDTVELLVYTQIALLRLIHQKLSLQIPLHLLSLVRGRSQRQSCCIENVPLSRPLVALTYSAPPFKNLLNVVYNCVCGVFSKKLA
jgi:hypothetical protein